MHYDTLQLVGKLGRGVLNCSGWERAIASRNIQAKARMGNGSRAGG